MSHVHTMPDGEATGTEVLDPANADLHWHIVSGVRTESSAFGPNHTHYLDGVESSLPEMKSANDKMEVKSLGGKVVSTKEETREGQKYGIVKGYIATWDVDRGNDRFVRGAFLDSIADHKARNRPVRLKDHHGRTLGMFPIETVVEDDKGLYGVGEINLKVEQGRDLYELIKQGVLSDFSVGFIPVDFSYENGGEVRVIEKAILFEGSVVDEPMNQKANITEVKSVVPFQDLPLASRDRRWDVDAATGRVRSSTNSTDEPSRTYRRAFLWFDKEDAENFGAYELLIADVVNGELTAVPRAIFAAAAAIQGARGGVDIPDGDRGRVIANLERYYRKMELDSPFDDDKKSFHPEPTERNVEQALVIFGYSRKDAKALSSKLKVDKSQEEDETNGYEATLSKALVDEIEKLTKKLKG